MVRSAISLFIITTTTWALPAHDTRSFRDVQSEVEERMVSDERGQALSLLAHRLKDEKHESVRADLRKLQDQISETFLTEKAMQSYQLGRSLVFSDVPLAISKFNEALQLEPENLAVDAALVRAYLHGGECARALKDSSLALELNENYRPILFTKLQSLVCLQKIKEAEDFLDQKLSDPAVANLVMTQIARAQLALLNHNAETAHNALEKAKSLDSKMPEVYYWLGQAADQEKKDSVLYYRQYLEFCQEPNRDKRTQYELEPRTCLESKSVERLLESRAAKPKGSL